MAFKPCRSRPFKVQAGEGDHLYSEVSLPWQVSDWYRTHIGFMGFYKNKAKQNTSIYNEKSDLSMKYNERDKIVLK